MGPTWVYVGGCISLLICKVMGCKYATSNKHHLQRVTRWNNLKARTKGHPYSPFSLYSYYCPRGTNVTIPCEKGTYGPTEQLGSQAECKGCEPGEFCAKDGLNETSGNCSAGFFCRRNASVNEPTDGITGEYCEIHFA